MFLKKRVPKTVWFSVVLAVAGLYCLCVTESFTISSGDICVMLCAVVFTIQILSVDHFAEFVDGVELSCAQFFFMTVFSLVGTLLFETPTWAGIQGAMGQILYVGIFSSGVAYTLQILGQRDVNPAIASLIMCLESVFSALGGWLLLSQSHSAREAFGCPLIYAAVVLAQLPLEMLHLAKKAS